VPLSCSRCSLVVLRYSALLRIRQLAGDWLRKLHPSQVSVTSALLTAHQSSHASLLPPRRRAPITASVDCIQRSQTDDQPSTRPETGGWKKCRTYLGAQAPRYALLCKLTCTANLEPPHSLIQHKKKHPASLSLPFSSKPSNPLRAIHSNSVFSRLFSSFPELCSFVYFYFKSSNKLITINSAISVVAGRLQSCPLAH